MGSEKGEKKDDRVSGIVGAALARLDENLERFLTTARGEASRTRDDIEALRSLENMSVGGIMLAAEVAAVGIIDTRGNTLPRFQPGSPLYLQNFPAPTVVVAPDNLKPGRYRLVVALIPERAS